MSRTFQFSKNLTINQEYKKTISSSCKSCYHTIMTVRGFNEIENVVLIVCISVISTLET
jgi:hypothetical protein